MIALWHEQLGTANFFSFCVMVMVEIFDAATSAGHLMCQPVLLDTCPGPWIVQFFSLYLILPESEYTKCCCYKGFIMYPVVYIYNYLFILSLGNTFLFCNNPFDDSNWKKNTAVHI